MDDGEIEIESINLIHSNDATSAIPPPLDMPSVTVIRPATRDVPNQSVFARWNMTA